MTKSPLDLDITSGQLVISFREDVETAVDYAKMGQTRYRVVITIKEQGEELAGYSKWFEEYPEGAYYNNFVKKFLREPSYRHKYRETGNWQGVVISYTREGKPINPVCQQMIQQLNSTPKNKLRFKDFMRLKTGGRDHFSALKEEVLKRLVADPAYTQAKQESQNRHWDQKDFEVCLRWIARGLNTNLAIRKVNVDKEIEMNKIQKR